MIHSLALLAALAAHAAAPEAPEFKLPPKLEFKRVVSEWSECVSPDGTLFATGDPSGVNVWKFGDTKPLAHIAYPGVPAEYDEVLPQAISRDNKRLLISRKKLGAWKGKTSFELAVADIESEKILGAVPARPVRMPKPGFKGITVAEFYGKGFFSEDGELASYTSIFQIDDETNGSENIVFNAQGRVLETKAWRRKWINGNWVEDDAAPSNTCFRNKAGGSPFEVRIDAGSCAVMDCAKGKRVAYLDECDAKSYSKAWVTFDGSRVVAEGRTNNRLTVAAWDAATGKSIRTFVYAPEKPWQEETYNPYAVDVNGRFIAIQANHLDDKGRPDAHRLDLMSVDTGERLDRLESSGEAGIVRALANDGSVAFLFTRDESNDRGTMNMWRFGPGRGTPAAAPAQSAASGFNVDQAPKSAIKINPNAYAIVIGVEKYRSAAIPAVDFAANDAKAMHAHLTQSMGFDSKNVVMLSNGEATKTDFEKNFGKWLLNRVDAKSRVFVYYAGHGAPNPTTGAGYLMPFEADPSYLDETAYPVARLYAELAKLPTKDVTVVLDACFSGQGQRSLIAAGTRPLVAVKQTKAPPNLLVIAAAEGTQISASDPVARHGLLTYHLLAGLKGGADGNKDGRITAHEAFAYAKPAVERAARLQNVEQTPTLSGTADEAGPSWIILEGN